MLETNRKTSDWSFRQKYLSFLIGHRFVPKLSCHTYDPLFWVYLPIGFAHGRPYEYYHGWIIITMDEHNHCHGLRVTIHNLLIKCVFIDEKIHKKYSLQWRAVFTPFLRNKPTCLPVETLFSLKFLIHFIFYERTKCPDCHFL